nr:immunoglobulin heavy chain junction region [Macaca mulatta]MOV48502.1 immunoglobulin heavy chain junction region [Macaca mulatta]
CTRDCSSTDRSSEYSRFDVW